MASLILSYSYQKRKNFGMVSWEMCLVERYTFGPDVKRPI